MQMSGEYLSTQKTFRILLQAMSRPGRVYNIGGFVPDSSIEPFTQPALMLVLQTLLDHEVTFNVLGHQKEDSEYKIIRATGSRTANIDGADFVIILSSGSDREILRAKRGSLEYPDIGATVIYSINSLLLAPPIQTGGTRGEFRITLKGPGIDGEITPFISGINKDVFHYLKEINSEYPLGVDSIFIDGASRIMCIPRSTKIEVV